MDEGESTFDACIMGLTLDPAFTPRHTVRKAYFLATLTYAYDKQSIERNVLVSSGDDTEFVIAGTGDTRGLATAGLGLTLSLGKVTTAYARYDAVLPTGNVRAQSVQAGIDHRF